MAWIRLMPTAAHFPHHFEMRPGRETERPELLVIRGKSVEFDRALGPMMGSYELARSDGELRVYRRTDAGDGAPSGDGT